jgi:hypothetical protein
MEDGMKPPCVKNKDTAPVPPVIVQRFAKLPAAGQMKSNVPVKPTLSQDAKPTNTASSVTQKLNVPTPAQFTVTMLLNTMKVSKTKRAVGKMNAVTRYLAAMDKNVLISVR